MKNKIHLITLGGKSRAEVLGNINHAKALMNDGNDEETVCKMKYSSEHLPVRGYVSFTDKEDFFAQTDKNNIKYIDISENISYGKKNVFLFPGHGVHQKNMLSLLCGVNGFFAEKISEIDRISSKYYHIGLLDESKDDNVIRQLRIFTSEIAIAGFWEKCGVTADYCIGHSFGEYATACFCGVMGIDEAVEMIVKRSRILDIHSDYQMSAVEVSAEKIRSIAEESGVKIHISGFNAPEITTITADRKSMGILLKKCSSQKINLNIINPNGGGHFDGLQKQAEEFGRQIENISFRTPSRKIISTVYPDSENSFMSAEYWSEHICRPVLFSQAVQKLPTDSIGRMIDTGVSPVLLGMAMKNIGNKNISWIPSVRAGRNYAQQIHSALGTAYISGADISVP